MFDPTIAKPYIDLITWQVVVLLGGLVFAPAIYLVVFRLRTLSMGLLTAGLTQKEAKAIDRQVEEEVEEDASREPTSAPEQAADEISAISTDSPIDKKDMYQNIVQAWSNLSVIVRTLAAPHGGQSSLKAYLANLDIITRLQLLPREEIQRLRELHHRRFELGRNPSLLTPQTYQAYLRRARRTANRLTSRLNTSGAASTHVPAGEHRSIN